MAHTQTDLRDAVVQFRIHSQPQSTGSLPLECASQRREQWQK